MLANRLTMDTDYHDICYFGAGSPADVEQLFDNMALSGFDATIWDCFWCGTTLYQSSKFPVFTNAARWENRFGLAENLRKFDPLSLATKLGKERNIQVLPYFRLLEEAYTPNDGHEFFRNNPEFWWQSRCGMYRMIGWPCYNYPEVREHMLSRLDDLVGHGATGVLFGLARTHIPYYVAYRQGEDGETFGFNKPVVEEFKKRYGIDLAKFDHVEDVSVADHRGLPFTYERRWVGTEPYDMWAFRRLLGEGFNLFLKEARSRHPQLYIALECGLLESSGKEYDSASKAVFRIDLEGLCAEGVIDEFIYPGSFRKSDINDIMLPRFSHVLDSGRQLTAWLNDFFSGDGGGTADVTVNDVASYIDSFLASDLDGAVIHEAQFLVGSVNPVGMWKQLSRLKGL